MANVCRGPEPRLLLAACVHIRVSGCRLQAGLLQDIVHFMNFDVRCLLLLWYVFPLCLQAGLLPVWQLL